MDVRLPNGKVIKNVPDGTSKDAIRQKAIQSGLATEADFGTKPDLSARRAEVAEGITLRPFGIDTGIEMPQWMTEGLAGAGRRMMQIGSLGTYDTPDEVGQLLDDSTAATVGGAATDIAVMALGGAGLKALSAVPKIGGLLGTAGQAIQAPKSLAQAASGMAGYGALTSEDRVSGATAGLLGGSVGYGVPKIAGAVAKPAIQKGAQVLRNKGIRLTPGEMLGGTTQRVEDALTSFPLLGDSIKSAKARSVAGFNRAAIDDALGLVGRKLDDVPAGRDAVAAADDIISSRYDEILDGMNVKMDQPLRQTISRIQSMVDDLDYKGNRAKVFKQDILGAIEKYTDNPTDTMLGRTFKEVTRSIREKYRKWQGSNDMISSKIGDAAREVHQALLDAAKRQNPKLARELSKTDAAYAAMSRVRGASESLGAADGVFTPAQLLREVKKGAKGTKKFGRGEAYGQEFAEAAKGVLPSTVPDSGTFGRTATGLLAAGLLYGGDEAGLVPGGTPAAAALLGGAALYTPAGQAAMRSLLSRPAGAAAVRKALERSAPYTGLLGAGVQINQQ